jgi:pilus assembly protein CpaE
LSSRVLAALDCSDHHVLLTTFEYPALRQLRLTADMLALLASRGVTRSIVVNRVDDDGALSDAAVDEVIRAPVAGRVPSSPAVAISINERTPLAVSDPWHPVVLALRGFAETHLGLPPQAVVRAAERARDRDPPR